MFDGQQLGETIVAQVKGFLDREVAPLKAENEALRERIKALEERPIPELPTLPEMPVIELPDFEKMVEDAVGVAVAAIPVPKDGKDAANIVEALKDSGELVLTLQDGRLIRTGIRDGTDGVSPEITSSESWAGDLSMEEKTGLVSSMLRKELGDDDLIVLPDPISQPSTAQPPVVVHNHLPKRGTEKTVVTKHDERGRILEFECREA